MDRISLGKPLHIREICGEAEKLPYLAVQDGIPYVPRSSQHEPKHSLHQILHV